MPWEWPGVQATLPESPPGCPRGWAILEPEVKEKILNQKSSPLTLVFMEQHSARAGPAALLRAQPQVLAAITADNKRL